MCSDLRTDALKEKLLWLAANPGEWLRWGDKRFSSSSRQLKAPTFETKYVSPSVKSFENHPLHDWIPGLYVRRSV